MLFLSQQITISYKNMFESKKNNKKYQNIKIKQKISNPKNINLKQIIRLHNMDSKLIFWTQFVHEQT
jgi:hypothetical protein